jgi:hypothetical protein
MTQLRPFLLRLRRLAAAIADRLGVTPSTSPGSWIIVRNDLVRREEDGQIAGLFVIASLTKQEGR